jgi:hypothetical protein
MTTRSSEEVWARMVEQAAEDVAWRHAIDEVAAMSDEQLDAELRGVELDPKELEREAVALFIRPPPEGGGQPVGENVFQRPVTPQRRRPLAMAVWLVAAAVATAGAGGLLYTWLHHPSEQPAPPPPPAPSPEPLPPPPVDSSLPIATMTPAELRAKAKAAFDDHRPDDCLKLLDDAKRVDPAGDATPEMKTLRQRAILALGTKPGDKPQP